MYRPKPALSMSCIGTVFTGRPIRLSWSPCRFDRIETGSCGWRGRIESDIDSGIFVAWHFSSPSYGAAQCSANRSKLIPMALPRSGEPQSNAAPKISADGLANGLNGGGSRPPMMQPYLAKRIRRLVQPGRDRTRLTVTAGPLVAGRLGAQQIASWSLPSGTHSRDPPLALPNARK
jgi:hypothetical protein